MIRIETTTKNLYDKIGSEDATWLSKAETRTATYRKKGSYTTDAGSDFWGDIKNVYIDLQHEKCAYCETKLAGKDLASKVHEVEHFRPKSSVKKWPGTPKKGVTPFVPPCAVGGQSAKGYYLLSYHPLNYAIACTRCNSTLKSDYFPVRGKRNVKGADPTKLQGEDALLVYPLSNVDVDPSKIIRFDGVLAVPAKKSGKAFERAVVTIEFFKLNHEDLTTRRAQIIAMLWRTLCTLQLTSLSASLRKAHEDAVRLTTEARGEFSACARDYVELFDSDNALANKYGKLAQGLIGG